MQMIFIGAALLVCAALGFWGFIIICKWALHKFDARVYSSIARRAEREITRREVEMRKYCMDDLRPARKS